MQLRLTPVVKVLLVTLFAAFIVQQTADLYFGGNLLGWFGLVPAAFMINHRFWQVFTYAFFHADVMHLFLNLMMLAFIGSEIEAAWGRVKFLKYYFFCSVSAGALYLFLQVLIQKDQGLHIPMVGASGAIYGLLLAYGLIFGERVMLFMMLFPMKAKHFVWVLAGIEFMSTAFSARGGLSSAAHLGGMAAGLIYLYVKASISLAKKRKEIGRLSKPKKKRAGDHLKLVINNPNSPKKPAGGTRGQSEGGDDGDSDDNPKTWH